MSKPNWNEMSDSDSQDSWFDDDAPAKTEETKMIAPSSLQSGTAQQNKPQLDIPNNEGKKSQSKRAYLKDEQIIEQLLSKKIQQNKTIKVIRCLTSEAKQIIQKLNNLRGKKQYSQGNYILNFKSEEDLISFIREKIEHRYRFYLQPFIKSNKPNQRADRPRQDREAHQDRDARQYKPREQKETKQEYQKRKNYKGKQAEQDRPKKQFASKYEQKPDPNYQINKNYIYIKNESFEIKNIISSLKKSNLSKQFAKIRIYVSPKFVGKALLLCDEIKRELGFQLQKQPAIDNSKQETQLVLTSKAKQCFEVKQNSIHLISQEFSVSSVLQALKNGKITKQFTKIKIYTSPKLWEKANRLCSQIYKEFQYGFQKQPIIDDSKQEIQLVLAENAKAFIQKNTKEEKPKVKHAESVKVQQKLRHLNYNTDHYFKCIDEMNVSELEKGFNEGQYLKKMKDSYKEVFKVWKSWIIRAQNQNIESLLKLSHKIQQDLQLNVSIEVGSRGQAPLAQIKLALDQQKQAQKEKEKRPKIDVSPINNYLINN